jgi:hypothetical protein
MELTPYYREAGTSLLQTLNRIGIGHELLQTSTTRTNERRLGLAEGFKDAKGVVTYTRTRLERIDR